MTLIAGVRAPDDSDATTTDRLNALFATEAERVANAAVLAEILVPMIAEQLHSLNAPSAIGAEISAPAVVAPVASKTVPPRPASIADFIDDMLAQERPLDRPAPGAQRRAS